METNKIRAKVHMLPTEEYTGIVLHGSGLDHFHDNPQSIIVAIEEIGGTPQHIYLTICENIKEGDKMLTHKGVETAGYDGYSFNNNDDGEFCLKIIATTDTKLRLKYDNIKSVRYNGVETNLLPQPSQQFIKEYCDQGGFDEVDVEYELKPIPGGVPMEYGKLLDATNPLNFQLKVDPIHNTITTHLIEKEKMYSREEAEANLSKFGNYLRDNYYGMGTPKLIPLTKGLSPGTVDEILNDWIKDNLKQ